MPSASKTSPREPARVNQPGIVLVAGPLIQLDRNDREVVALLAVAREAQAPILIPGTALAQAICAPARQARLNRLLRQPRTTIIPQASCSQDSETIRRRRS